MISSAHRVLIVEDEHHLAEGLRFNLVAEGYEADVVDNGEAALDRLVGVDRQHYDVVVLDVMLPGKDGFEVCRAIRAHDQVPIIMLTARSDAIDIVVGLESGADDYVTKPFETRVLLARIKAVLRRQERPPAEPVLRFGDLAIDPGGMAVTRAGVDLHLTPTELKLLLELARRPGQVFTRALLLERVWDYSYLGDSRLVDVCVQRLRGKIEDDPAHPTLVQTVRGVGYKLVPPQ